MLAANSRGAVPSASHDWLGKTNWLRGSEHRVKSLAAFVSNAA